MKSFNSAYNPETATIDYWDCFGTPIIDGNKVFMDGDVVEVRELGSDENGWCLCTDATNHVWIEDGRAEPWQMGGYPLCMETNLVFVLDPDEKVTTEGNVMRFVTLDGVPLRYDRSTGLLV